MVGDIEKVIMLYYFKLTRAGYPAKDNKLKKLQLVDHLCFFIIFRALGRREL